MNHSVLHGLTGRHPPSEPGASNNLVEALQQLALEHTASLTFYDQAMEPTKLAYAELLDLVQRRAAALRAVCPERGARVALLLVDCQDFVVTFLGAVWGGLVPVPLALPSMQRQRGYLETVSGVLNKAGAHVLVHSRVLTEQLATLTSDDGVQRHAVEELADLPPCTPVEPADPGELCFLQFTSGSTAHPKGVRVSHRNLIENVGAITTGLDLHAERDVFLSWLPLYHDMGLIGFLLTPIVTRIPAVLYPTSAFVWRPSTWLQLVDRHRATVSFAPNFAYGLAARRQKNIESLDLSCVRVLGCGAEPIHADTLRAFIDTFTKAKLPPTVVMPAYGMAEHTLAISFESYAEPLRTVRIDNAIYESEGRAVIARDDAAPASTLEVVSCGKPFYKHAIAIVDREGSLLPERTLGEIVLRGPSVTAGYYSDPEQTEALFVHGWLRTGDIGFLHDGNVYVSGRSKDVMIINGRNVHPHDLEWVLTTLAGLRPGRIAAFSVPRGDTEAVVIVAEPVGAGTEALRDAIVAAATELLGVAPAEILFVASNQIPQTSSGKVQRGRARALYLAGSLRRTSLTD